MSFLNLLKTFSSEHRQTTLSPHSYFIHICDIFMNVHHYNNKYTGLNSLRTNTIASWWADYSNGATSPATAQGPLQPRAHCCPRPTAAQGPRWPGGGLPRVSTWAGKRRVSSCCQLRCHMTVLFPSLLIYGQACKCPRVCLMSQFLIAELGWNHKCEEYMCITD